MEEEAYVEKFHFRPYDGSRRGRLWRLWIIAWFNMTHQWHRSRVLKIVVAFILLILILSNLTLLTGINMLLETNTANEILEDHLWGTIRNFVRFQVMITSPDEVDPVFDTGYSIIMLIGLIMMGSGLISDDLRHKVMEVYDSKISRSEYLIGKYGALILFGNILFTLPCILEWILAVIGINGVDIIAALPILLGVIIFTEVLIFVLTSFILTFSSLTQKRLYAGLFTFLFFLAISTIRSALVGSPETFSPLMYLDFFTVLSVFSFMLQGEKTVIYYDTTVTGIDFSLPFDLTGLAGILVIPMILFFIIASLSICSFQLTWRHSLSWRFWKKFPLFGKKKNS
jgi:ABC-type transport system involved in multi-copper enzyme maturation permease subunit